MEALRILIADDHPLFRHGLRTLLAALPDAAVVGEATTGEEVLALAAGAQPDVILMDIKMPGVNGIEATRRVLAASPHVRVLIVTMFEDDASVFAAMRAAARGHLLKGAEKEEVLVAIRAVARGEAVFGPAIAQRLIRYFAATPAAPAAQAAFPELTDREREILGLLAQRHTNAEIAGALRLTTKTVSNYVSNILGKLQVADRAEAILRARAAGLDGA